jgi:hypothetical protein
MAKRTITPTETKRQTQHTKVCFRCKLDRPLADFSFRKAGGTGQRNRICDECRSNPVIDQKRLDSNARAAYRQTQKKAELYAVVNALKEDRGCDDCHQKFHPYAMDFDHKEGAVKVSCISMMINQRFPIETILAEIEKCDLVCAVCHRMRTLARRGFHTKPIPLPPARLKVTKSQLTTAMSACEECGKMYLKYRMTQRWCCGSCGRRNWMKRTGYKPPNARERTIPLTQSTRIN